MSRFAFISMHTSPTETPGKGDAGGMNVVEFHQAKALANLGHEVDLITRRTSPDTPDYVAISSGVRLRYVPAGPARPLAKSLIDAHIEEFRAGLGDLSGYDAIHSNHWMSGVAALPLAQSAGIPHVQTFHSVAALPDSPLAHGEPPESPARIPGEQLVAKQSDAVVAVSAAEARTVVERCGAEPNRVHIISPGVDGEVFSPDAARPSPWGPYLAFAARLQPLKGADLAIEALAQVPESLRPKLVIAGEVSVDFADFDVALHELVERHGLRDHVVFLGPQSRQELARLLASATITLVPSHSETFGLVALESASCGTPVIASASGGLREAVAHGETGQLMDSRRPEDWGQAITMLLLNPAKLHWMRVVSRIHARRFDWTWAARRLVHLYDSLGR